MKDLSNHEDVRIKILYHLSTSQKGLTQVPSNPWLSEITTPEGKHDLGTIRRSLKDLEHSKLIIQTISIDRSDLRVHWDTDLKTHIEIGAVETKKNWKDSRRLLGEVGDAPRVEKSIYIGITLKGWKFLIDLEHDAINTETNLNIQETNVGHTTLITKQRKTHNWIVGATIAMAVGAIGTIVLALIPNRESKALDQIDFQLQKIQNEMSTPHYHEGSLIYIHDTIYVDSVIHDSINIAN